MYGGGNDLFCDFLNKSAEKHEESAGVLERSFDVQQSQFPGATKTRPTANKVDAGSKRKTKQKNKIESA